MAMLSRRKTSRLARIQHTSPPVAWRSLCFVPVEDRCLLSVEPGLAQGPLAIKVVQSGPDPVIAIQEPADNSQFRVSEFQSSARWNSTATNGSGLSQGDPTTLT